jgi:hypothetical protein
MSRGLKTSEMARLFVSLSKSGVAVARDVHPPFPWKSTFDGGPVARRRPRSGEGPWQRRLVQAVTATVLLPGQRVSMAPQVAVPNR